MIARKPYEHTFALHAQAAPRQLTSLAYHRRPNALEYISVAHNGCNDGRSLLDMLLQVVNCVACRCNQVHSMSPSHADACMSHASTDCSF